METTRRDWLRLSLMGLPLLTSLEGQAERGISSKVVPPAEDKIKRLLYNENPYGPSPLVLERIAESIHLSNRYATFSRYDFQDLKALIAQQEGLKPENILLSHGSFDVLTWVSTYFGANGGQLIVPNPTFDVVGNFGRSIGAEVMPVDVDRDFRIDLERMAAEVSHRTKLVTLCNPNNPTGTSCDTDQLRSFYEAIPDSAFVLVDEAYIHYLQDWRDRTMARYVADDRNLLVTRTFSKIYGMAGLRIGFLLGPADLIKALEARYTLGFPGNMPNALSVAAAMASLEDDAFVLDSLEKNDQLRSSFTRELASLGLDYIESDTNFVYYDVEHFPKYKAAMWENGILLAGGWPSKPNWARATIGSPADMDFLIEKMKGKPWL